MDARNETNFVADPTNEQRQEMLDTEKESIRSSLDEMTIDSMGMVFICDKPMSEEERAEIPDGANSKIFISAVGNLDAIGAMIHQFLERDKDLFSAFMKAVMKGEIEKAIASKDPNKVAQLVTAVMGIENPPSFPPGGVGGNA